MKFIQKIVSTEEYLEIIDKLEFPTLYKQYDGQEAYHNTIEMASIILEDLDVFFPHGKLFGYLSDEYSFKIINEFKEYLKEYVVFKTSCGINYQHADEIKKNKLMTDSRNILFSLVPENEKNKETKFVQGPTNYSRNLKKKNGNLGAYFDLEGSNDKFVVKYDIWPFIGYVSANYGEGHTVLKRKTSLTKIKKDKIAKYIHTWREYNIQIDPDIKGLNIYLFEREYNIHLIKSIARANLNHFNNKDNVFKVLSLLLLLPDIFGRIELINFLCRIPLGNNVETILKKEENGEEVEKILMKDELLWYRTAVNIVLQLAYLIMPVSEKIHTYLYKMSCGINEVSEKENNASYMSNDKIENLLDDPFASLILSDFDQIRKYTIEVCLIREAHPPSDFIMKLKKEEAKDNSQIEYNEAFEAARSAYRIEARSLVDSELKELVEIYLNKLGLNN
ncbi:hypothetical protein B1748_33140 [Paenibacillus sp. MY03]|uniref:hypothetical protein n=1 Tax=Paenibacillus sp. MY03 TaxID=302980 RepID=UPI000B3D4802|nr:hypothetical protein [Paenibacillus sp. MY03]OUS68701.1 hypothetical protein B1748_33140 [Paenibacillus sp. MY03]